jgi:hypothetical protein
LKAALMTDKKLTFVFINSAAPLTGELDKLPRNSPLLAEMQRGDCVMFGPHQLVVVHNIYLADRASILFGLDLASPGNGLSTTSETDQPQSLSIPVDLTVDVGKMG